MSVELLVLVADVQQEKTLETLLHRRTNALGIRALTLAIYRHPRKDSGVYHEAPEFLAPLHSSPEQRAIVFLDYDWSGAPGDAASLRQDLQQRLMNKGWAEEKCQVIVVQPELEMWVWSPSSAVPEILGMTWEDIHAFAQQKGYWAAGQRKPHQPKLLLEGLLEKQRRPRSSAIFQKIAERVSLKRVKTPLFLCCARR